MVGIDEFEALLDEIEADVERDLKVVPFPGPTVGEVPAGDVLHGAFLAGLKEVVIIGIDADGERYFASSQRDERTLYLMERAKHFILSSDGPIARYQD